jgi:hypothetical protein
MTQVFKVLKNFELDGEAVRSGKEVVCRAREAEKLQKEGFITPSDRELDPADPKDAELITKSNERAGRRHAEIKENIAERDAEKEEREVGKDVDRVARVEKAKVLAEKVGRTEDVEALEAMSIEQLDREIEVMSAALPTAPEETKEDTTEETKTEVVPPAPRNRAPKG